MRLCPSVEGSASPLITHRIGVDVCLARQASNFHKCHRCIYRGQAASWENPNAELPALDVIVAEPARRHAGKTVEIPRPDRKAPGGKSPARRSAPTRSASTRNGAVSDPE